MSRVTSETAAIYRRISRDPEGLREGVQRQDEDSRALADRLNLEVVAEYEDNDIGASNLSKKPRPQYAAMLEAARAGRFGAIVAYSNSRLTRRLRELEDLLDLHDQHGVAIHTVVSGSDDLSTADGRMTARIKASVDAAEAERTGERLRRAFLEKARRGDVNNGSPPFGWQDDKLTLAPLESRLIRQAADDVIDGVGLLSIARAWNAQGVRTIRGNEWGHRALRQLLKRPRLAGWRVHQGKIVHDADGKPVRGQWEPLMDQDTFDRLQAALSGRQGASRGRRGARRYLLSGVLRCGRCGGRMYGTPTASNYGYVCRKAGGSEQHTVSASGPRADEAVTAVVMARLDMEELDALEPGEFPEAARLAEIPDKIAELMAAYNAGQLSATVAFGQVEKLEAEAAELAVMRQKFITASAGPTVVSAASFPEADTDRQRAVIEELLDAVVVAPSSSGVNWNGDRLTYVWRTA